MIDNRMLADLNGKTVIGPDGEDIGKIKDVYESTDGSGGTFATVSTGLFGSGASFFPLDAADLRGGKVHVPFHKDVIKDAPRVENDEELTAPEEHRLFEYYADVPGARTATTGTGGATATTTGATSGDAMTRSEEKLHVGTEKVETGRARLRKRVVTETETRTVPVSHDELKVEREPITDGNVDAATSGPAFKEDEHEVVLNAEKPMVKKEEVPVERVRLGKETVTEHASVTEDVRKEQIDLDGAADVYPSDEVTDAQKAEQRR